MQTKRRFGFRNPPMNIGWSDSDKNLMRAALEYNLEVSRRSFIEWLERLPNITSFRKMLYEK